jgi:ADP-ribose pyrophosphatase YjhB (NUDIX family)
VTAPALHSHCSACGAPFPPGQDGWPRRCPSCGTVSYRNPLPVAVMVLPVAGAGLLMIERAIAPTGLAFPGGFVEWGESWQQAAVRELREETGVAVAPDAVSVLAVRSAPDGTLLVFGTAPEVPPSALADFEPSSEVSRLVLVDGPRDDVVFPLHAEVLAERLAA